MKRNFLMLSIGLLCCGLLFAQEEGEKKKKGLLKGFVESASEALSTKPLYWQMSLISPIEIVTSGLDYVIDEQDYKIEFYPGFGPGKLGKMGPEYICIAVTNKSSSDLTINWAEMKISNPKEDGFRNGIKIYQNASTYSPGQQTIKPGEKIQTCVTTAKCVRTYYHAGHYNDQGNWVNEWYELSDIKIFCNEDLPLEISDMTSVEKIKPELVGKTFTIYLPLSVNGAEVLKEFKFRIEDVTTWEQK